MICMACQDEISDRLKGKWQLQSVEENGVTIEVDTVWYNFQSESLFMYQIYRASSHDYLHTYGYKTQPDEHTLKLELINYVILVKDFLPHTDWKSGTRTFTINKIDSRRMILKGDDKIYTFRKH